MSGMTLVILGGVLLAGGTLLGGIGWKKVDTERQGLSLSVPSSIEIDTRLAGDEVQEVVITNSGPHDIVDVVATPVFYIIQKDPLKVVSRTIATGGVPIAKELAPRQSARTPAASVTYAVSDAIDPHVQAQAVAVVVVYRRKLDNKRYVEIEPYLVGIPQPKKPWLFPLFAGKGAASGGPTALTMGIMKEMIEGERFYFNAR